MLRYDLCKTSELHCDSSCGVTEVDYLICAVGSDGTLVYNDGSGYCRESTSCYGLGFLNLPNCQCHSLRKTCRYRNHLALDFHCFSCADGSDATSVYIDGSGYYGELSGYYGSGYVILPNCKWHFSCEVCGYILNPKRISIALLVKMSQR